MNRAEYEDLCDPKKIMKWLRPYIGHEHLADIKEVSLDKYLAVAPDVYVMASMIQTMLLRAAEQKTFGEYGDDEEKSMKSWNTLTDKEKISQREVRAAYMAGRRRGRDMAFVEMANRITIAARQDLDKYRLENPEYDPELVVDESTLPELE